MEDQIKDIKFYEEIVSELELKKITLTGLFYEIKILEYFLDDVKSGKTKDEIKKTRMNDPFGALDPFNHIWDRECKLK